MRDETVNQGKVVTEALALLQEGGLKSVTFRKIAARLDIKGPSLYTHIHDKSYLLGLMTRSIMSECLAEVGEADTWQEWLYGFGMSLWRSQLRMRDCSLLLQQAKWEEPWLLTFTDHLADTLCKYGLKRRDTMVMHSSVQALITGYATFATGPNAPHFASVLGAGVDAGVKRSLRALIEGWAQNVTLTAAAKPR